jgi:hypothetical protein
MTVSWKKSQDGKEEIKPTWGYEMTGAVQTEEVREAAGRVSLFQARRV